MKEKIDLLIDLDEKEKAKLPKYYATLALSTYEELKSVVEYLKTKNIKITKVSQIKILGNTLEELQNKFSVLEQIETSDILNQDPININKNVIDIYKRITYCKQYGIEIKNEDGTYKGFLFSSATWKAELEKNGKKEEIKEEAPVVKTEVIEEPSSPSVTAPETKEDYFEKIRAELEETRKALYTEFQNLDLNEEHTEEDLISFDDLDDFKMGRAA